MNHSNRELVSVTHSFGEQCSPLSLNGVLLIFFWKTIVLKLYDFVLNFKSNINPSPSKWISHSFISRFSYISSFSVIQAMLSEAWWWFLWNKNWFSPFNFVCLSFDSGKFLSPYSLIFFSSKYSLGNVYWTFCVKQFFVCLFGRSLDPECQAFCISLCFHNETQKFCWKACQELPKFSNSWVIL